MNDTSRWIRITNVANIPLREGRSVTIDGSEIAIFNLGDRFLAVESRCPHKGGPLAEGIVTGNTVVCPLHAWKINLETGGVTNQGAEPRCIKTFAARVEDDVILIEIPRSSASIDNLSCGKSGWPLSQETSLPNLPT